MNLFNFSFLLTRVLHENKKNKKILKELEQKEQQLLSDYDLMIKRTKDKRHGTVKCRVLGKDKTLHGDSKYGEYTKYQVCVEVIEDTLCAGLNLKKGQRINLKTQYDYLHCSERDTVTVHCYIRVDENGNEVSPIVYIKGEPYSFTLEDCRHRFLATS